MIIEMVMIIPLFSCRKNDESATLRHRDWLARVAAGTWERRKDFPVTRDAVDHALEEMEEEDRR